MQSMSMCPTVNLLPMLCGLRVVCLSDTTFSSTETVEPIHVVSGTDSDWPKEPFVTCGPEYPQEKGAIF